MEIGQNYRKKCFFANHQRTANHREKKEKIIIAYSVSIHMQKTVCPIWSGSLRTDTPYVARVHFYCYPTSFENGTRYERISLVGCPTVFSVFQLIFRIGKLQKKYVEKLYKLALKHVPFSKTGFCFTGNLLKQKKIDLLFFYWLLVAKIRFQISCFVLN
jgi:hypothetical protein